MLQGGTLCARLLAVQAPLEPPLRRCRHSNLVLRQSAVTNPWGRSRLLATGWGLVHTASGGAEAQVLCESLPPGAAAAFALARRDIIVPDALACEARAV